MAQQMIRAGIFTTILLSLALGLVWIPSAQAADNPSTITEQVISDVKAVLGNSQETLSTNIEAQLQQLAHEISAVHGLLAKESPNVYQKFIRLLAEIASQEQGSRIDDPQSLARQALVNFTQELQSSHLTTPELKSLAQSVYRIIHSFNASSVRSLGIQASKWSRLKTAGVVGISLAGLLGIGLAWRHFRQKSPEGTVSTPLAEQTATIAQVTRSPLIDERPVPPTSDVSGTGIPKPTPGKTDPTGSTPPPSTAPGTPTSLSDAEQPTDPLLKTPPQVPRARSKSPAPKDKPKRGAAVSDSLRASPARPTTAQAVPSMAGSAVDTNPVATTTDGLIHLKTARSELKQIRAEQPGDAAKTDEEHIAFTLELDLSRVVELVTQIARSNGDLALLDTTNESISRITPTNKLRPYADLALKLAASEVAAAIAPSNCSDGASPLAKFNRKGNKPFVRVSFKKIESNDEARPNKVLSFVTSLAQGTTTYAPGHFVNTQLTQRQTHTDLCKTLKRELGITLRRLNASEDLTSQIFPHIPVK